MNPRIFFGQILLNLVLFSAVYAGPQEPRELTATVTSETGGPFFLSWRGSEQAAFYRLMKTAYDASNPTWVPVGETKQSHWLFKDQANGQYKFRAQSCPQKGACSQWAYSDWITVADPPEAYEIGEGSFCGPKTPPEEITKQWDAFFEEEAEHASTLAPDEEIRSPDIDPKRLLLNKWSVASIEDAPNHDVAASPFSDADGDCLIDDNDPFPLDSDADNDGWFDGACNVRVKLILTEVKALDETEDLGKDEFYVVVDKARFPNSSGANAHWSLDHGDKKETEIVVATRTRGILENQSLAAVSVFGMEDDVDPFGNWKVDDTLFSHDLNLDDFDNGQSFTLSKSGSDFSYVLTFRVETERFADPDVIDASADTDGDGMSDADEGAIGQLLGGIIDPYRKDIVVEVDNFRSGKTYVDAMRQVHTAFARKGVALFTLQTQLERDTCLSRAEVRDHYNNSFDLVSLNGVRYGMLGNDFYNDRSGVRSGRSFVSGTPTVKFGNERAIAGTFMHELGHTLGLVQSDFHLIDKTSVVNLGYRSSMTYFYQPLSVSYSSEQGGGGFTDDFDDWEHISVDTSPNPQSGNQSSFMLSPFGFNGLNQSGGDICR